VTLVQLGLSPLLKGTLTDFDPIGSGIQISYLMVTLSARLPAPLGVCVWMCVCVCGYVYVCVRDSAVQGDSGGESSISC
jgi:hypothetical protein